MGASVYWQPVKGRCITPNLRSKFVEALELPRMLGSEHYSFLRGLAAGEPDFREAVDALIEGIDKHGTIRVWAEY